MSRIKLMIADDLLMDINTTALNGIRATEQILERQPQPRIVRLTMLEGDASVFHARRVGSGDIY